MSLPLATLTAADGVGLLVAAAVCAFLLYALLRGENL
jgi:F subunit of K+-transporting ATPase (Potass_KdpF)